MAAADPQPVLTPAASPARRPRLGVMLLVLGLAVGVLALDQAAKFLVVENLPEGRAVPILGELLEFVFVRNPGAAFSLGGGITWIFAIVASAVVVTVIVFARRIRSYAWAVVFGALLGGTLGNLVDRLFREPGFGQGHVIDFIKIWGFPAIFNIADIALTGSVVLLVILTLLGRRIDGVRHDQPKPAGS